MNSLCPSFIESMGCLKFTRLHPGAKKQELSCAQPKEDGNIKIFLANLFCVNLNLKLLCLY